MIKKIIAVVAVILIIGMGVVAYSFLRAPAEASGPIEAIPITTGVDESKVAEANSATTTAFPYTDFELFIPDSPSVNTIDDVVRLELEFVAEAVS